MQTMASAVMMIVDTVVKKTEQQLSDSSKTLQVRRGDGCLLNRLWRSCKQASKHTNAFLFHLRKVLIAGAVGGLNAMSKKG